MKHIITVLLILLILSSCKNNPIDYETKAIADTAIIMEQSRLSALNKPEIIALQSFDSMDSIQYKGVMSDLITVTAEMLYEADQAIFLTPDCLTNPSKVIDDQKGKEKAMQDSIYHSVLRAKAELLKDTRKFNSFNHLDYRVYHEQLSEILKEMRRFCSEEFIESLEKSRNMAVKRLEE